MQAQQQVRQGTVAPADSSARLAAALCEPSAYPHTPQRVLHLETHISHVFLTGPWAYKIKKPLNLGFLDFSNLEKRQRYCAEELRINRRLAPELYLDVVAISGTADRPQVEGKGAPIEYAVKMQQFSQEGMLERVLERGELSGELVDTIALQVAQFHAGLPPAALETAFGTPASVTGPARQNFEQLAPLIDSTEQRAMLDGLRRWSEAQADLLEEALAARKRDGFVRECHGDLHLGNMVLVDGRVRIFDAIEFNPELRWIDVINETAFLVMDLTQRARADLAWRFLNGYLEHTGDYAGARLLRYYIVYRALVRAKVAALRAAQPGQSAAQRKTLHAKVGAHLRLADHVATAARPALIIHFGFSGSGKTTASQWILESIGAIRVRSDVERKRLHGLPASARTGAALGAGLYAQEDTRATYERLAAAAEAVLLGGGVALVDATFLSAQQRDRFRALAQSLSVPFGIAHFSADPSVLRKRVMRRQHEQRDASEAGLEVLQHQLEAHDPLSDAERKCTFEFDTEHMSSHAIRERARQMLAHLTSQL